MSECEVRSVECEVAKHTKGDWVISENTKYAGMETVSVGVAGTKKAVAICGDTKAEDFDESLANARLIAAAPEMLEALENIENDDNSIPETIWNMVQTAIAKAKGGQL